MVPRQLSTSLADSTHPARGPVMVDAIDTSGAAPESDAALAEVEGGMARLSVNRKG